jgi:hypothetical protein
VEGADPRERRPAGWQELQQQAYGFAWFCFWYSVAEVVLTWAVWSVLARPHLLIQAGLSGLALIGAALLTIGIRKIARRERATGRAALGLVCASALDYLLWSPQARLLAAAVVLFTAVSLVPVSGLRGRRPSPPGC